MSNYFIELADSRGSTPSQRRTWRPAFRDSGSPSPSSVRLPHFKTV